jgi:hypothetical protein
MFSVLAPFLLSGMNMYVSIALHSVNKKFGDTAFQFLNFKN